MFAYKTLISPTVDAVNVPVEILTTNSDLMTEYVVSLVVQASNLGPEESVAVLEGKGPTPIWEAVKIFPSGGSVVLTSSSGSVCLEGRGVRYAVTKTATAVPVGVYAVLQYEPR